MPAVDPLAAAVLSWLLTYFVHSSILLGLTWAATRWWVRANEWRDVLWKTAFAGGILTASLQVALPLEPLGGRVAIASAVSTVAARSEKRPATKNLERVPDQSNDVPLPEASPVAPASLRVSPAAMAAAAWLLVGALLVGALLWSRLRLAIRLGERKPIRRTELNRTLERLAGSTGMRRRVKLTMTHSFSSPLALGVGEICVPAAALTELDSEQQEAMLAHELAHLARFDPLWLWFTGLVERIFFFQPLNRLARRRIQESAEYLCDDWAVRRTGAGLGLAKCLAKVAEWIDTAPTAAPVAGMAEDRSHLVARVRRLIEESAMTTQPKTRLLVPAAVGILGITVLAFPGFTATAAPRTAEPAALLDTLERQTAAPAVERDDSTYRLEAGSASEPATPPARGQAPVQDTTRAVVTALLAAANDPDVEVRRAVIRGLGNHRDPRAIPVLTNALRDDDAEVRVGAIEALGEFKHTGAANAIAAALADPSAEVRREAADALSDLELKTAPAGLIAALDDSNVEVRREVAEALGDIGDRSAVSGLMKALGDPSAEVRHAAAHSLGEIGDPRAANALVAVLRDPNADVRSAAIDAVSDMELESLPPAFIDALRDASAEVRERAARAVGDREMARAVPALRTLLDDPVPDVREAAVEALGEIRTTEAIDALVAALKSADPVVRKAAAEALGQR